MMRRIFRYCLVSMMASSVFSCAHYKDIPYFQNSAEFDGNKGMGLYDLTIKPKDKLAIFVFSPNDKEAVAPFNIRDPREPEYDEGKIRADGRSRIHLYLVDNDGNIDFPIIGKVKVEGLTITQTNNRISEMIKPYFQKNADYIVNTYIDNFVVSVLGEVKKPNTFSITRPRINVLEALALAGDMTIYGKRDNVKILRELYDGTYEVYELDMRDANILNSPYYYLQQRDIVYVEPNETMA